MSDAVKPLIDVREDETFLADKATAEKALGYANAFASKEPFKDRAEADRAADAIKALNIARRDGEKHKLGITAEWRETTKHVNAHYKELLSLVEAAEEALKQKGLAFKRLEEARVAEERRRREAEEAEKQRKAEAAAQEAQEAAELAAEDSSPEIQQLAADAHRDAAAAAIETAAPAPPIHDAPKQLRGDFGRLGSYTVYKHTIADAALVPDRFKTVDRAAVKAAVDAEAKAAKAAERDFNLEIPGVRIHSEEIAVSR